MPMFSIFFFIFTICKAAVPLSANWIGEFLCLTGIFQKAITNGHLLFVMGTLILQRVQKCEVR